MSAVFNINRLNNKKFLALFASFLLGVLGVLISPANSAQALVGSDFKAGNIIDDATFFNGSTMTPDDIQNFLNVKVPNCDTWGSKMHSSGQTRAQYGASKGNPAPYTCLKSYSQNTPSRSAENQLCGAYTGGTKSSARIIYDVAKACGINPKVLLVLLQKEQSLISDDWPWNIQYRSATGFGCPDTAPCDAEYYGFFNQVYNAARIYKKYARDAQLYNYRSGRNNNILYNPNHGCGSSSVYIQNQATAGLYVYTPYQPNKAALDNLYGLGDGCSAYGNRNFWRLYNDWFGPTSGSPFFQIGHSFYIHGVGNTYYWVPTPPVLEAYGYSKIFGKRASNVDLSFVSDKQYLGPLPWIARFEGPAINVVTTQGLHHFTSEQSYLGFGYSFGQEAVLPQYLGQYFPKAAPMNTVLKEYQSKPVYLLENKKKRHISNETIYKTQGSPVYESRPSVALPKDYLSTLPTGAPLLSSGQVTKNSDNGQFGLYAGGTLYPLNSSVSNAWNPSSPYSASGNVLAQLTQGSALNSYFAKDSVGNRYLLTPWVKYSLSEEQFTKLAPSGSTPQTVPNDVLNRFSNASMKPLLRQKNSNSVYIPQGGKLYHINSEKDLYDLGYNFNNVAVVDFSPTKYVPNSGIKKFASGRLVREDGTLPVYIIDDNFKRYHIPSEDLFKNQYGFAFKDVSVIQKGGLTGYTDGQPLTRLINDGSNYWLVDSKCKWKISTQLASKYNYTSANFKSVGNKVHSALPLCSDLTNLIRANNSPKVYEIENGKRRWITSEAALNNRGYTFASVRVLSPGYVNTIPSGSNID